MKAVIYSRKSKFKEEGESIENQINMCIKYAQINLGIEDYDIFQDEGYSAKNTDRPDYQRMMMGIKNKKYTHFICYRLDRAFRNVSDYSYNMEIFKKYNVNFVSIKEQFDTTTAMGRAMMNVSATFAQLERETTAERIKDNLRELSKTGRWLGGPAPMGYNSVEVENTDGKGKSRKKHILKINKAEIEIPKLVFKLFLEHKSFQRVSRILESNNIFSRKGRVFSRELVKQTINNPIYVIADKKIINYFKLNNCEIYNTDKIEGINGIMPYNRRKENGSFAPIEDWIISIGEHEGIIDSDTWIKCQKMCNEIKKHSSRTGTSHHALLSGLVVCAKCYSSMAPRQNQSHKKYEYRYYSCNLRNKASNRCGNDALDAFVGEDYVIKKLMNLTKEDMIFQYNNHVKMRDNKVSNRKLISNFSKEIERNKKSISNLVMKMAYMDNDPMLLEPFKNEIKSITNKNIELQDKIEQLKIENEDIILITETLDEYLQRLENFKKNINLCTDFEEKKNLIRNLVKFILWDSSTGIIDVILVGSDKERPKPYLPLDDSSRRNGPC